MKKTFWGLVLFCAVLLTVQPSVVRAETSIDQTEYQVSLLELIELLQQQILLLQTQLAAQQEVVELATSVIEPSVLGQQVKPIVTYQINNPAAVYDISNAEHRTYFARVFELFPTEYDLQLKQLMVFDGLDAQFDAYVETLPPEHDSWQYAVNEDLVADYGSYLNDELVVHELAHIISYEEMNGVPKPSVARCDPYFDYHGCPAKNSYLGQFVNEFWSSTDLDQAEQFTESGDPIGAAFDYYEENTDDFVSDYAAFGPEEDFSESFMYFIFDKDLDGELAEEKVQFFANDKKMREVKEDILQKL